MTRIYMDYGGGDH